MKDRRPSLVRTESSSDDVVLPHEKLDVYGVLEEAYRTVTSWQGVAWSRGTRGDQLKRALSGALLRYTEGYYATGGNKPALWESARASCGRSATAVRVLVLDGRVSGAEALRVRALLNRKYADARPASASEAGELTPTLLSVAHADAVVHADAVLSSTLLPLSPTLLPLSPPPPLSLTSSPPLSLTSSLTLSLTSSLSLSPTLVGGSGRLLQGPRSCSSCLVPAVTRGRCPGTRDPHNL